MNCVHHLGYPISARPRKSPEVVGGMSVSAITSPERVGRTRSRVAGVSQSQRKLCLVVDVTLVAWPLGVLHTIKKIVR